MKKLAQTAPEGESEEDQMAFSVKALTTLVAAADKLLAAKPDDDQAAQAFAYKIEALQALTAMDQPDAGKQLEEVLAAARDRQARTDHRPRLAEHDRGRASRIGRRSTPKDMQAFIDLIVNKVKAGPAPIDVSIVQVTSMQLEDRDD